jgi:hypothetical protein
MTAKAAEVVRDLLVLRPLEQVEPHFADFLRGTAVSEGPVTISDRVESPRPHTYVRDMYLGPQRERLTTTFELCATGPEQTTVVLRQKVPAHMAEEVQALTDTHNFYTFTRALTLFCDRMNGLETPDDLGVEF